MRLWLLGRKWRRLKPCGRPNRDLRSAISGPLGMGCRAGLGRAHGEVEAQWSLEGDQSPGLSPPNSPFLPVPFHGPGPTESISSWQLLCGRHPGARRWSVSSVARGRPQRGLNTCPVLWLGAHVLQVGGGEGTMLLGRDTAADTQAGLVMASGGNSSG